MTPPFASALYPGLVTHHRLRPREHRLAYRVWSMLLDLDELPELDRRLRLFSVDRFNLFSFHARDRGDGTGRDLRGQVEDAMRRAGMAPDGGPIRLFTMPRFLGWGFNPLSIFFCHAHDGRLTAILWEVDNTFGERHGYLIPVEETVGGEIRQRCDKAFHVSPFMDMDQTYAFRVKPPTELFSLVIDVHDADGRILEARHLARRETLSDRALLRLFFAVPFLTLRVVGGIHWEALKLWLKGVKLRFKPPPPTEPITVVHPEPFRKAAS
ncbi:MAG: DUF1365 family protein [Phyllobacteriaceae bacterium]|nr:DUF1365 family protein [Phyllobacteriaceae bacterium]